MYPSCFYAFFFVSGCFSLSAFYYLIIDGLGLSVALGCLPGDSIIFSHIRFVFILVHDINWLLVSLTCCFFSSDRVAGTFSTWLLGLIWLLIVPCTRVQGIDIVNSLAMPRTRRAETQHSVLPDECFPIFLYSYFPISYFPTFAFCF